VGDCIAIGQKCFDLFSLNITSKFKLNSAAAQLIKPRDAIARELGLLLGVI
jgi:hypothetical protein